MSPVVAIELASLAVFVLVTLAVYKIITKAGYPSPWIIVWIAPFAITYIGSKVVGSSVTNADNVQNAAQNGIQGAIALLVVDGLLALVLVILFFVFAFSDWPVQRELRRSRELNQLAGVDGHKHGAAAVASFAQMPSSGPVSYGSSACPSCHQAIEVDDTYCGWCGVALPVAGRSPW